MHLIIKESLNAYAALILKGKNGILEETGEQADVKRDEYMRKKKLLFIYNPKAGKAQIRNHLLDIIDVFTKSGYEVTAKPTQAAGEAVFMVKDREDGYEIVVCSGGDGTLDEVVTGMMQCDRRIPIGYIPAGSTNDFANSLKLPKNMTTAAQTVVNGRRFLCDAGVFNEDYFVYIAAFGLFTDVSYETKQETKNVLGHMAYLLEGMKRIPAIKTFHFKVFHDGEAIEDDFVFGMVTNSISVGGFKRITGKNVSLDDGVFEVTLVKMPGNPIELNEIMVALLNRDIDTEHMYCFKSSEIRFESEEEISWTLDGEYGGSHKEVTVRNREKAIEIIVPEDK